MKKLLFTLLATTLFIPRMRGFSMGETAELRDLELWQSNNPKNYEEILQAALSQAQTNLDQSLKDLKNQVQSAQAALDDYHAKIKRLAELKEKYNAWQSRIGG